MWSIYNLGVSGDENTVDVSSDDHQLLAYHFHIPESLCGELEILHFHLDDAFIPTLFEILCKQLLKFWTFII